MFSHLHCPLSAGPIPGFCLLGKNSSGKKKTQCFYELFLLTMQRLQIPAIVSALRAQTICKSTVVTVVF